MSIDRQSLLPLNGTNPKAMQIVACHRAHKTINSLGRILEVICVYIWKEMEYNNFITIIL